MYIYFDRALNAYIKLNTDPHPPTFNPLNTVEILLSSLVDDTNGFPSVFTGTLYGVDYQGGCSSKQ